MSRLDSMLEYIYVKRNDWVNLEHNDEYIMKAFEEGKFWSDPLIFRGVEDIRIIADEERKKKSGFQRFVQRMRKKRNLAQKLGYHSVVSKIPKGGFEESDSDDEESEGEVDEEVEKKAQALKKYGLLYKVTETSTGTIVCSVLEQHGFTKVQKMTWNILWCGKHLKVYYLQKMNMFQRVNHFPKTSEITRKNYLYRNYDRCLKLFGDEHFNYLPLTFSLPYEYDIFKAYLEEHEGEKDCIFIMKPSMLSRGRGVYVISKFSELHYEYHPPDEEGKFEFSRPRTKDDGDEIISIPKEKIAEKRMKLGVPRLGVSSSSNNNNNEEEDEGEEVEMVPINEKYIASIYLDDPYLIHGKKFDLRIYVAVTCFHPLRIYVYKDGLTRFASEKYQKGNYSNNFVHLTNYSINKRNKKFVYNVSAKKDNVGNKWSLRAVREYLSKKISEAKIDDVFEEIYKVINLSFISIEKTVMRQIRNFVPYRKNCFELFGFDILLDSKLKPWLLEVNLSPSLGCRYPLDFKIKSGLLVDLFNMLEICPYDRERPVHKDRLFRYRPSMKDTQIMVSEILEIDKSALPFDLSKYPEIDFSDCSVVDALVIKETIDEDRKKGGFIRIFPTMENCDVYDDVFEEGPRPFNLLLSKKMFGRKIDNEKINKIKRENYERGEQERKLREASREERRKRMRERREREQQQQQQQDQQDQQQEGQSDQQ